MTNVTPLLPMTAGMHKHPDFPLYRIHAGGQVFSNRSRRFLKPQQMGAYLGLMITDVNGNIVKRYLHRLVLEAVVGPCPGGMEARHLNGDRHDNRAANLAWGTKRQNESDKVSHGTTPRGSRNPMAKLTWERVRDIRQLARSGMPQNRIAEKFGVSKMTISRVVRHESWQEKAR